MRAGRAVSNAKLAVGCGLTVALVASFLPWHQNSIPSGYACQACSLYSPYTDSFSAFGYWPGWIFIVAVLAGVVLFALRMFAPRLTIPPLLVTDAVIYTGIGVVMLLCALLWVVTGAGYAHQYLVLLAQGPLASTPGFGLFIGVIAAAAVGFGGFLMRAEPPATRSLTSLQSPPSPAAPTLP
jgi:hypothetical protein